MENSNMMLYNPSATFSLFMLLAKEKIMYLIIFMFLITVFCGKISEKINTKSNETIEVIDGTGRTVRIPVKVKSIICSGTGCLRYATYLQAQEMVVAVDNAEKNDNMKILDTKPYSIANSTYAELPLFGEFRGHDNLELIVGLEPQPDVIFKTNISSGVSPDELQKKTGIPVVTLHYGDLFKYKKDFKNSLSIMGKVIGKEKRANDVISFFDNAINDIENRCKDILESKKPSCYVGGVAFKGPHGFQSTEPNYSPFILTNSNNVSSGESNKKRKMKNAIISKEKIIVWDPDFVFLDLSTLQTNQNSNALYELKNDPVYKDMKCFKNGNLFGLLPYNSYTTNFGSVLANTYYVGTILYPDKFPDIDPKKKADDIYTFLVGASVFDKMNTIFNGMAFDRIGLK